MRFAQPDMAIFRWYDEDAGPDARIFIQLFFDEDDKLDSTGKLFTVKGDDSYNQLEYDQIVFAEETDGGTGSIQLCTFTIAKNDGSPAMVCMMEIEDLNTMVASLLDTYNQET